MKKGVVTLFRVTLLDPIGKIFFSRVSRSVPFSKKKDPRRGGGPKKQNTNPISQKAPGSLTTTVVDVWAQSAIHTSQPEFSNVRILVHSSIHHFIC